MPQAQVRTILISGCSSGLGRDLTRLLLQEGHVVIATARKLSSLQEFKKRPNCFTTTLDVTKQSSILGLKRFLGQNDLKVDILVNNAGYGYYGPLEEASDADWKKQFETNVFGLMALTRMILPPMRERGHGRIVNISSLVGLVSFPFLGIYSSSKFALEGITTALRGELREFGVKVVSVNPGPVVTSFAKTSRGDGLDALKKNSPYRGTYGRALEKMGTGDDHVEEKNLTADKAVITIMNACLDKRPRPRYYITSFARLMTILKWVLPEKLFDYLLLRGMGIA